MLFSPLKNTLFSFFEQIKEKSFEVDKFVDAVLAESQFKRQR